MNYKKIGQQLIKEGLVDDRMIMCHSNRTCSTTQDRVLYQKYTTIGNDKKMPTFMLLSIKDEVLNISFAKAFGGFKKAYATIKLANLYFQEKLTVNKMTDVYVFEIVRPDENRLDNFFIIATQGKKEASILVDTIIEYHK